MNRPVRHDRKLAVLRLNQTLSDAGHAKARKALQSSFGPGYRVVLLPANVETIEIREPAFA